MQTTIIYAHPYQASFNHAILQELIYKLNANGMGFHLIDLYADEFNPALSTKELELYQLGESLDPLVHKYQTILKDTDQLFIIFPIWWNNMPAILKGFLDKVLLKNFAYDLTKIGLLSGKLTHIKRATIISTSNSPRIFLWLVGNVVKHIFGRGILKSVGVQQVKYLHCGNCKNESARKKFIHKLANIEINPN